MMIRMSPIEMTGLYRQNSYRQNHTDYYLPQHLYYYNTLKLLYRNFFIIEK